jgi:tellurite resistance protein TerC
MLLGFLAAFVVLILALIAIDLGLIGRQAHVISVREALIRTAIWASISCAFSVFIYFLYGHNWLHWDEYYKPQTNPATALGGWRAMALYLQAYVLELSLSVDNMFVIATIFAYFRIPIALQHRVLFWGIIGALVLRGVMIGIGAVLLHKFHWTIYIFGGLLIVTAIKMLLTGEAEIHPERNLMVRMARRFYPVSTAMEQNHFFVRVPDAAGRLHRAMTPLFLALLLVETTDVMFAIDSIPAVFGITSDPFIVFTSNVFAICGLRSLYFALAGLMDKFRFLKPSLVFLLVFIGVKMIWNGLHHLQPQRQIDDLLSMAIIGGILAVGVIASLIADRKSHATSRTR